MKTLTLWPNDKFNQIFLRGNFLEFLHLRNLLISSLLFHNYKKSIWYAVKDSTFDFSSLVSILGDCFVLIDKGRFFMSLANLYDSLELCSFKCRLIYGHNLFSLGQYLSHIFQQFQPTNAHNCHLIHNNIFINIKLLQNSY